MSVLLSFLAAATANLDGAVDGANSDQIIVTGRRTERQDDYSVDRQTTTMRFPLTPRETPQSVSTVTRAQIEDFQLNDINDLLRTTPGVQVQQQETDRIYYSARGFDIQTFQIDGIGLPFAFQVQTGTIDTAIYDHIDVVRGAPGLLSSTGNPSAVVNFIRKRPTKDFRVTANAQYGSFDHVRLDGDVSVPLTSEGNIRARAVGVYDDGDSYLDRYHLRRWTGYGIIEADLGPDTTLTGGYGHQDHQSRGAQWGSLPLNYTDGTRIDLDRSANSGADYAGWNVIDRQIFGDLVHHFNNDWYAKLTVIRRAISENDKLFYALGTPDRTTGNGVFAFISRYKGETRNLTLDAYVAGKLTMFGRQHDVLFGLNRSGQRYRQGSSAGTFAPMTFAQIYDGSFPEPTFAPDYSYSFLLGLDTTTTRETAYGLLRFNLADRLKVMAGGNFTHATSEGYSYGTVTAYKRDRFLPFVGATLDLTGNISAYASYATIFRPQTQTDTSQRLIEPISGDNLEAGVKGEWYDGRLTASAAIFQTRQNNTAEEAGASVINGSLVTLFRGVDAKSQGLEFEIAGQLLPGLQATGSYTLMRIRGENDEPVRTFVPRNLAKINIVYSPPRYDQIKFGASAQYQSRIYNDPLGAVSTTTGRQIRLQQDGYALVDVFARYELTPHLSLSANVRNVTNSKYIQALNFNQGFYGAPRTVLGTVSLRY